MVLATLGGDIALILGAVGVLIAAMTSAFIALMSQRRIDKIADRQITDREASRAEHEATLAVTEDTHAQVVTLNESTIGELAAADETRRAEAITHDDRTEMEQRHIDTAPPVGPPQGPQTLAKRLAHVEAVGDETHDRVEQVHQAVQGNGDPPATLVELVQGLIDRFDGQAERLDAMEAMIGIPRRPPEPRD